MRRGESPPPLPADLKVPRALALLALDATDMPLIERFERMAASEGARGVLITNDTTVDLYQRRDLVAEYLPSPLQVMQATGEGMQITQAYLSRRLQNTLDKWVAVECLWIGETAAGIVACLVRDPSESRAVTFRPFGSASRD
jgi:hypothetical protein